MEIITLKIIEYERLIVQLSIIKGGIRKKQKFLQKGYSLARSLF